MSCDFSEKSTKDLVCLINPNTFNPFQSVVTYGIINPCPISEELALKLNQHIVGRTPCSSKKRNPLLDKTNFHSLIFFLRQPLHAAPLRATPATTRRGAPPLHPSPNPAPVGPAWPGSGPARTREAYPPAPCARICSPSSTHLSATFNSPGIVIVFVRTYPSLCINYFFIRVI